MNEVRRTSLSIHVTLLVGAHPALCGERTGPQGASPRCAVERREELNSLLTPSLFLARARATTRRTPRVPPAPAGGDRPGQDPHRPGRGRRRARRGLRELLKRIRAGGGPLLAFRPYLLQTVRTVVVDASRRTRRLVVVEDPESVADLDADTEPTTPSSTRSTNAPRWGGHSARCRTGGRPSCGSPSSMAPTAMRSPRSSASTWAGSRRWAIAPARACAVRTSTHTW